MQGPVVVFGITTQAFSDQVTNLRKKVRDLGYEEDPEELLTVSHLTLSWKKEFDFSQSKEVKKLVADVIGIFQPFSLIVTSFEIMDQNIAAKFDNSFSRGLAKKVSDKLKDLGFELVATDHMKLVRSKIKPEHLEKVRHIVEELLPQKIEIIGIALAGHLIKKEDILWIIE